jgi:DNA-binding MarR family transcriptional regulator
MDKNGCTERNRRYMDAWLQMIRTYDHLQSQVATLLQSHGLTVPQFEVLSTLAATACSNQQELADQVPEDRRVNRVRITEAGRTLIHGVLPEQAGIVEQMLSGLDDTEVNALRELLHKLLPPVN